MNKTGSSSLGMAGVYWPNTADVDMAGTCLTAGSAYDNLTVGFNVTCKRHITWSFLPSLDSCKANVSLPSLSLSLVSLRFATWVSLFLAKISFYSFSLVIMVSELTLKTSNSEFDFQGVLHSSFMP